MFICQNAEGVRGHSKGGGTFFKLGGKRVHVKTTIEKIVVWIGNCDVTDIKYNAITYSP